MLSEEEASRRCKERGQRLLKQEENEGNKCSDSCTRSTQYEIKKLKFLFLGYGILPRLKTKKKGFEFLVCSVSRHAPREHHFSFPLSDVGRCVCMRVGMSQYRYANLGRIKGEFDWSWHWTFLLLWMSFRVEGSKCAAERHSMRTAWTFSLIWMMNLYFLCWITLNSPWYCWRRGFLWICRSRTWHMISKILCHAR